MDKNELQELLQTLDEAGQIKLRVLHNASIDGLEAYRKKPTQANLKNWQAAEKALDAFLEENRSQRAKPQATNLPNLKAVIAFLQANGWQAPKSTVYLHRQKGKLSAKKNGTFDPQRVLAYAAANLSRADGPTETDGENGDIDEIETLQRQKLIADAKKAAAQADHWDLKTKIQTGEYIPRAEFERALAARAVVLKNDLQTFFRSLGAEIIQIVDGDAAKTPDLIDFCLEKLEVFLGRYAERGREFTAEIDRPRTEEKGGQQDGNVKADV